MVFPFPLSAYFVDYKKKEKDGKEYYSVRLLFEGSTFVETISYIGDPAILDSFVLHEELSALVSIRPFNTNKEEYFNKRFDCLSLRRKVK